MENRWNPNWDDSEYQTYLMYHRPDEVHRDWAEKRFTKWLALLRAGEIKTSRLGFADNESEDWMTEHFGATNPEIRLDNTTLDWLINNVYSSHLEFPSEIKARLAKENAAILKEAEQLETRAKQLREKAAQTK